MGGVVSVSFMCLFPILLAFVYESWVTFFVSFALVVFLVWTSMVPNVFLV